MKFWIFAACLLAALTAQAQAPVVGRDYVEIPNGRPLELSDGHVVNGRYLVGGESYVDMLRIATALIDKERATRR
jgi:hypothetical protein